MSAFDWFGLRPSSQPPLTRPQALALPVGMVVLRRFEDRTYEPCLICKPRLPDKVYYRSPWQVIGGDWSAQMPIWLQSVSPEIRLPRLPRMSFALTTDAIRERRKDVTRRLALPKWWQTGRWFLGVDKVRTAGAQGLCVAQCVGARQEPLWDMDWEDLRREGFSADEMTLDDFTNLFRRANPKADLSRIWRLEFRYLEVPK